MRRAMVLLSFVVAGTAPATTIDPLTFEQMVTGADLVGVVECEVAGELIARYRVVESWKGPEAGAVVSVQIPPNVWGPLVPTTLVGERFVLAAYRRAPSTMASTTSGPGDPIWWRKLVPDYELPLFQGIYRLPAERGLLEATGSVDEVHQRAKALLAMSPERQQVQVIASLFVKELGRDRRRKPPAEADVAKVRAAPSPDAALVVLDAWARKKGEEARSAVERIRYRLERARRAVVIQKSEPEEPRATPPPLEAKEREELRAKLQKPGSGGSWSAFDTLTRRDCASVVEVLARPLPEEQSGYQVGSFVGVECRPDRAANLAALAEKAADPWIRAAAAVSLAYEDEARGLAALKKLQAQPGGPGAWAALALARRGDRQALAVAVRLLEQKPDDWQDPICTLHKRIAVLLSNSAKAAGLPPPPFPPGTDWEEPERVKPALEWWKQHAGALQPVDPWFAELKALHQD